MKINVMGTEYKIIFEELENDCGNADIEKKIIHIDTGEETEKRITEVVGHELAHCYINEMYMHDILSDDAQEMVCNLVALVLKNHIELLYGFHCGTD